MLYRKLELNIVVKLFIQRKQGDKKTRSLYLKHTPKLFKNGDTLK